MGIGGLPFAGKKSRMRSYTNVQKKKLKQGYKVRKNQADRLFAKYVLYRDGWEYYKRSGILTLKYGIPVAPCCTCTKILPIVNSYEYGVMANCGHYITRDKITTRYDEMNCHIQCVRCNDHGKGEQAAHARYIDKKYGDGTSEQLFIKGSLSRRGMKFDVRHLLKIEETAKKNAEEIKKAFVSVGVPEVIPCVNW